jgi:hypothetical protein
LEQSGLDVEFRNFGWGAVRNAKFAYAFGPETNPTAEFVANLGLFDRAKTTSLVDALRKSNVELERIKRTTFTCASAEEVPACLRRVEASGMLGNLAGRVRTDPQSPGMVITDVRGRIDYEWKDSSGHDNTRSSPVYFPVKLFLFQNFGSECGGPDATDHSGKTLQLALDRRNYRLPINWHAELAPRGNARFGLALVAAKSSLHMFRLVIELGDGRKVFSRQVDLSYFRPRMADRPSQ